MLFSLISKTMTSIVGIDPFAGFFTNTVLLLAILSFFPACIVFFMKFYQSDLDPVAQVLMMVYIIPGIWAILFIISVILTLPFVMLLWFGKMFVVGWLNTLYIK